MNGYTLMADSYRKLMNEEKIEKADAEKRIRIYEFLATCDIADFCTMVDSSAFNDIIKAYIDIAVQNADISDESRDKVKAQLSCIFNNINAREALESYKKYNRIYRFLDD